MQHAKIRRVIKCRVLGHEYCFDTSCILSVRQGHELRTESVLTDQVAGVILHNGDEVPVFRMATLLGHEESDSENAREHVLLMSTDHGTCGLIVRDVSRAIDVSDEMLHPLPQLATNTEKPFFHGVVSFLQRKRNMDDSVIRQGTSAHDDFYQTSLDAALLVSPEGLFHSESSPYVRSVEISDTVFQWVRHHVAHQQSQLMLFRLPDVLIENKETSLALSVTQVLEVRPRKPILPVPGAPDALIGLAYWRERFVPVVNLSGLLGFDSQPIDARLVVACNNNNQLIAFHADSPRTLRLPIHSEPLEVPSLSNTSLVHGCYLASYSVLLVPSLEAVQRCIVELGDVAQRETSNVHALV